MFGRHLDLLPFSPRVYCQRSQSLKRWMSLHPRSRKYCRINRLNHLDGKIRLSFRVHRVADHHGKRLRRCHKLWTYRHRRQNCPLPPRTTYRPNLHQYKSISAEIGFKTTSSVLSTKPRNEDRQIWCLGWRDFVRMLNRCQICGMFWRPWFSSHPMPHSSKSSNVTSNRASNNTDARVKYQPVHISLLLFDTTTSLLLAHQNRLSPISTRKLLRKSQTPESLFTSIVPVL